MINYGSFQYVRIVDVKKDINDKTLTIPVIDIGPFNADFNAVGVVMLVIAYGNFVNT